MGSINLVIGWKQRKNSEMYFVFREDRVGKSKSVKHPKFLRDPAHWTNRFLYKELSDKRVDLKTIDNIFRTSLPKCYIISEWIAARDTMKHLRKAGSLTINPNLVEIVSKKYIKTVERVNEGVHRLEQIEKDLHDNVVKSFGPKGIRKLTRKDVKKWPVFTSIMTDLYNYLIPYYKTKRYHYEVRGWSSRERYPRKLFEAIAGLLQEYYPAYFKDFNPNAVKTRIKYPSQK